MKTSCIEHPEKEYLVLIRAWQIEACNKNHCAAALLSLFEYMHNIKLGGQLEAQKRNHIARKFNVEPKEAEDLWQNWNEDQLEEGLLHLYSRKTIRKGLEILIQKKFVVQGENPDKRIKGDRTKFFLFQPQKVKLWLNRHRKKKPSPGGSGGAPAAANQAKNHAAKLPDGQAKLPSHASGKIAEPSGKIASSSMQVTWEHVTTREGEAADAAKTSPPRADQLENRFIKMFFEHLGWQTGAAKITEASCNLILSTVSLDIAWKETLEIWETSNYSIQNLKGLLNRYLKLAEYYQRELSTSSVGSPPPIASNSGSEEIFREIERRGRQFLKERRAEQIAPYGLEELLDDVASIYTLPEAKLKELLAPLVEEGVNKPAQNPQEGAKTNA